VNLAQSPGTYRFQTRSAPLHGDAGGIADLDPDAAWAGPIDAIDPLGHDALGANPAIVRECGKPILDNVFVQQDACLNIAQQVRQRRP
jgi:hypothetical protein